MGRICSLCGKAQISGNNVSHSNIKTRRVWKTNVHKVKVTLPSGEVKRQYVCTRCQRTLRKQEA